MANSDVIKSIENFKKKYGNVESDGGRKNPSPKGSTTASNTSKNAPTSGIRNSDVLRFVYQHNGNNTGSNKDDFSNSLTSSLRQFSSVLGGNQNQSSTSNASDASAARKKIIDEYDSLVAELEAKEAKYTDEYWDNYLPVVVAQYDKRIKQEDREADFDGDSTNTSNTKDYNRYNNISSREEWDKARDAWEAEQQQLKARINELEPYAEAYKGAEALSDPEFREYAEKGRDMEDNPVMYARTNVLESGLNFGGKYNSRYHHMTETEVDIYCYFLAKYGKERADKYIGALEQFLNAREAKRRSDAIEDINDPFLQALATVGYDVVGGAVNSISHWDDIFYDEAQDPTVFEMYSGYMDEALADNGGWNIAGKTVGQWGHAGANTVGTMAPSIVAAYIAAKAGAPQWAAGLIGAGITAMQAGGTKYSQNLRAGYDIGASRKNAIATGIAEGGLQYALTGISTLGGINNSGIMASAKTIKNPFLRTAAVTGVKVGGEVLEENLQSYIEPALDTKYLGTQYKAPTWEEIRDTTIISALTTVVLEGGDIARTASNKSVYGERLLALGGDEAIVDTVEIGLKQPIDSEAHAVAKKLDAKIKRGDEVSAHEAGVLVEAIVVETGSLTIDPKYDTEVTPLATTTGEAMPTTLEEAAKVVVGESSTTKVNPITGEVYTVPVETATTPSSADVTVSSSGEVTEATKNLFYGRKTGLATVDGQTYVGDGIIALPVSDAQAVTDALGSRENGKVELFVKNVTDGDFVEISSDAVVGKIEGVGEVAVFKTKDGREVAIQRKYADYLNGYNLSATFSENGKARAVKATDAEGNLVAVVKAVVPMGSNTTYGIKNSKDVASKATFKELKATENKLKAMTGFGDYGVKALAKVLSTLPQSEHAAAVKSFRVAYEAGLTNLDTSKVSFATDIQRIAFMAGKRDYIMENGGDTSSKLTNIDSETKQAYNVDGKKDVPWTDADYTDAAEDSAAGEVQNRLTEYGVKSHVIKDSAWKNSGRKYPIYSKNGEVYMRETLDERLIDSYVAHEITHVMKQMEYEPYVEFVSNLPDMLNMSNGKARELFVIASHHRDIDISEMSDAEQTKLYDELNAIVFGTYAVKPDQVRGEYSEAFHDFDSYIAEMEELQSNFKAERGNSSEDLGRNGRIGSTGNSKDVETAQSEEGLRYGERTRDGADNGRAVASSVSRRGGVSDTQNSVKSHGDRAGFDSTNAPYHTTDTEKRIINKLYKAMGVKGGFANGLKGNAELRGNIGVAFIARDFQRTMGSGAYTRTVTAVDYAAHEVALHRLMELAPKAGRAFVDAMYQHLNIKGVADLAEAKRQDYAKQGVELSLEEAMEEVVANEILYLYDYDTKAFERALDKIIAENGTLAQKGAYKFKEILDTIISKLKEILEKLGIKDRAKVQAGLNEVIKLRDMFEKAMSAAVAKNKEIAKTSDLVTLSHGAVVDGKGNIVAQLNKDGTATFSLKTFDETGRAELNKWLDKNVKNNKLTEAEAKDISEQLEYFYNICKEYEDNYAPFSAWSKAEVVKGLDGKPLMSVVKANGDYKMNLDFSLVCKKRRPLDALYRAMIDDGFMDNIGQLSEVEVARINEIIRKHGFETACTLCFVDSKRYRQYAVADSFVSKYNELVKMLAPEGTKIDRFDFSGRRAASAEGLHTMSDTDLKKGINKLNKVIKENGETTVVGKIAKHLKAVQSDRKLVTVSDFMDSEGFVRVSKANPKVFKLYNSSKGSGGPKATLPDVQYLGEILKRSNFTPKKAYEVGGVRVQSFSDYIPRLVFDYLQMTADLTAKKLPAHAYSKEDIFVMQFGKTGIKINMSLVPAVAKDGIAAGLDKDGNYVWVDGHTFASDFHDKGSGQRGFELAVKIQNTEGYAENCGTIAVGVSDAHIEKMLKDNDIRMVIPYHLSSLNHFVAKMGNIDQYHDYTPVQNTRDKATGKKIEGKDFNFNEAFHRLGDAKAATQEYLAWCEKHNYLPKFDTFAFHEDAEVRENYYKLLIDFSAYDSNGNPTPQRAVTMTFPTESDAFGSMKDLIAKGLEADAVLEGRKEKQIPKILKEVKETIGATDTGKTKYSLKDSEGNTLTKEQQEYFKDSKVRDENGNLLVMYHGTSNGGFTVFDTYAYYSRFGLFGNGAYFTDNKDIAEQYTRKGKGKNPQVYSSYLNITNPIDMDAKANIEAWNDALQKTGEDFSLLDGEMTNEQAFKSMVEDLEYAEVYSYDAAEIVRNVFENMGYDGITHIGGGRVNRSDGTKHRVYIAFEQEQIKDITNINPTTNPDINLSLRDQSYIPAKELQKLKQAIADKNADALAKYVEGGAITTEVYNKLIEEFGAIPKGEKPARDVSVPKKTADGKKVSQTVRTILEAKATPDEAVPTIEKMVEDGVFSYDTYTDKQAISDAESYITEYGWDESLDDWFDAVSKGEVSKDLTAMGWALYNNAANKAATTSSETERTTAIKTSLKILDAMVKHQRSAAQALQATRILKKMSPETQLYGVQKSVQAFQRELEERYGKKAPKLKVDEGLAEQFLTAKTDEERAKAEAEIYKDIGRQMPSRFIDKWNAWRYLAMLGNVKTHLRNFFGNLVFAPVVNVKNVIATGMESAVHKLSGNKTVRSKALLNSTSKADRELISAAYADFANAAGMISNGGKYSDFAMASHQIEEGRQIFKTKLLEAARKGNSKLLEKEDMLFAKPHYAYALARYCKANNITAEQLQKGKALGNARNYAIKEAQKATYRDTNAISHLLSRRFNENGEYKGIAKLANMAVDGIVPFRKTPANILARGLEYSPLGLLNGIKQAVWDVQRGNKTSAEAIDSISAGLTGTGLMALGMLLASMGLVRGHGEDDEEKEFKEMMGHQAYSLELPNGTSVTLDWLAPEAIPFFVGVNYWEAKNKTGEEMNLSTWLEVLSGISEPMLEMSCLQGINDLIESFGYASANDTSGITALLSSAATSYLMQAIPTIGGQIERTGEENRMTTYTEKNSFLTKDMQYTLGKASAKIPFWDYNQIPYIDAWGRKEASGSALARGANNFLNPAYTSTIETSSMENELLRLYDKTGDASVFPTRADKYFMVDGKRKDLTAEEYEKYATLKGQKSYKLVTALVKSKAYKSLSNEEKVEAIEAVYEYADQKAKEAVSKYKPETWVTNADAFGSDVGNYFAFRAETSSARGEDGTLSKNEGVDIIIGAAQNDAEAWNMYLSMYDSYGANYAKNNGVDGLKYVEFVDTLDEVDKPTESGKMGTYTQEEATEAIRRITGISNRDRAILWQSVNKNWKPKNNPWGRYLP